MLALLLLAIAPAPTAAVANRPVPALDLVRYAGTWHEIAHLPMFFQRRCAGDVTATYTARPDGTIEVRNACRTTSGAREESVGVARPVAGQAGALKVRFAPAWLGWVPGVWADYWVIDLDPAYQWAVVGSPSKKYLWVLSRTPAMDRAVFAAIQARAAARGYPTDKLLMMGELREG